MMRSLHKAVFLDKDGTLIENVPYNVDPQLIQFSAGCKEALKLLDDAGFLLIVISNQPGLAKGYFSEEDLKKAEAYMKTAVSAWGVDFTAFYYCPHHPDGTVAEYSISCTCRKPAPGLVLRAIAEHRINPIASWFIGDILNDVEAGRRAHCRTILVDNGNETEWVSSAERKPHFIVNDIRQAAEIICRSGA